MKRYLLFTWPCYYPGGGCNDLNGFYDDLEEAKADAIEGKFEKAQILDTKDLTKINYWRDEGWEENWSELL